ATFLISKSDFMACGGYDESMRRGLEDWEFLIRLLNPNDLVLKVSETKVFYRIRESSRNNSLNKEEMQALKNYIYLKHLPKYIEYFGDYIELYKENQSNKEQLKAILQSNTFKISKKITRFFPFK
ncbi:MAG: hypothetical protein SNJ77_09855, partial [Cytophagales bacterium]